MGREDAAQTLAGAEEPHQRFVNLLNDEMFIFSTLCHLLLGNWLNLRRVAAMGSWTGIQWPGHHQKLPACPN